MNIEIIGIELINEHLWLPIQDAVAKILTSSDIANKSINVAFIDDDEMLSLQSTFKNKDYVTDVLSFPLPEMEKSFEHTKNILGDLVICVGQAERQAHELGHTFLEEVSVLVAHGFLHLLGYDHEKSKEDALIHMQEEIKLLEKAGFSQNLSLIKRQKD